MRRNDFHEGNEKPCDRLQNRNVRSEKKRADRRTALAVCIVLDWGMTARAQQGPPQVPPPPVPPQNPITEPKRVLGKILFWEEQLSSDNTVACGTCHRPFRAGADPRPAVHPGPDQNFGTPDDVFGSLGIARQDANGTPIADPIFGFETQVTPRSAQNMFGALWAPTVFWDGRAGPAFVNPQTGTTVIPNGGALEAQSVVPILADNEMAHQGRSWNEVISKLQNAAPLDFATYLPPDVESAIAANPTYSALFNSAFGDPAISAQRIAFAIATYERTLVVNQTPFDLQILTPQQQQGLNVFQNPASRCSVCHAPPLFTDNTFRNIGVRPIAEDTGRQAVTGNPVDAGRFKVPSLRNVGLKATFMHNGRRSTLAQVVDFYLGINGQVQFPQNQDPLIAGIAIPPQARPDLIEFLRNGLTDPRVVSESPPFDRPILSSELGDSDRDGDVDLADRAMFETCFTGTNAGPVDPGCERLDMDGDGDVSCDDWPLFTQVWTDAQPPTELAACVALGNVPSVSDWGLVTMFLVLLTAGTLVLRLATDTCSDRSIAFYRPNRRRNPAKAIG